MCCAFSTNVHSVSLVKRMVHNEVLPPSRLVALPGVHFLCLLSCDQHRCEQVGSYYELYIHILDVTYF